MPSTQGIEIVNNDYQKREDKMQLTVEIKSVYGVERIYAVCNNAKLITKLKQSKTLSKEDISILRELGYRIETKQPTI